MLVKENAYKWDTVPIPASHHFLSVYSQSSRLSFVCPLHPATTTTYTTWMRRKACATFSTSPSSTSDPLNTDFCPSCFSISVFSKSLPTCGESRCKRARRRAFRDACSLPEEGWPEPNIQISYFQGNLGKNRRSIFLDSYVL